MYKKRPKRNVNLRDYRRYLKALEHIGRMLFAENAGVIYIDYNLFKRFKLPHISRQE